ncbi:MAG: hypothetical protein MN733_08245, partial [Nitrososphaera sp.]|nr:hypothetical protein [Nitrososphaera sp.]
WTEKLSACTPAKARLSFLFYNETFISSSCCLQRNEKKFSPLEKKAADAMEMAAQAHEEREAQASSQSSSVNTLILL